MASEALGPGADELARLRSDVARLTAALAGSQERESELQEQLTATADVLRVIASSPTDLQAILETIAESAGRLCGAERGVIHRVEDDVCYLAATYNTTPELRRFLEARPVIQPSRESTVGRVMLERQTIHIPDVLADSTYHWAEQMGVRATLGVPLLREDALLGVIIIWKEEPEPFTDQQIDVVEAFADQAAIAIGNARLFRELQERTAQLTRSVDELRALGEVGRAVSSSLDLPTVLTTIIEYAARLSASDSGVLYEYDEAEGVFVMRASYQMHEAMVSVLRQARIRLGDSAVGRAGASRAPFQIEDITATEMMAPAIRQQLLADGGRAVLAVPLLREDRVLGGLVMSRRTPGAFPPEVVALLQTFATQSALAIHNARLYQTLEAQGRALEEASHHKSQFLANMSHELRTPLNAVIGYSEMLQEELDDLGQEELLPDVEKINAAGRHLLGLINDILDLSKIEAGKMELFLETFDVGQLVRDVATTVGPLAAKNGNTVEVDAAPDVGEMHGDATKVRQVLFNLLGNASKFTERGTITVSVRRDPSDWLTFAVSDTGIGMTEEQVERLFQPFSQAEASTTRRFGGTGLGLALVQHFCGMMGGDVAVESRYGAGSTFTVRLPATVPSPDRRAAAEDAMPDARRPARDTAATVLVIDDDPAARDLLRRHLESEGLRVVTAEGGEEGLKIAREIRPDLVTVDVLMPGLDGWAVLGALKGDPETAEIPVIVLTILDDRDLGYAIGAADYLTKPIDRDRLAAAVRRHVRTEGARRALVVEDDPATREMLRRSLQHDGWSVAEAANGRIGLERVAAAPPDLILLDLMMPEIDGFGFVERLRAEPAWRAIPVLVITAKDLTPEERLRLNGWVERVLQKGAYSRDQLLGEVRGLVRATLNDADRRPNASSA